MSRKDYLHRPDDDYNRFFKNLVQYCQKKCAAVPPATAPEWTHIPAADLAGLSGAYAAWYTAYAPTLKPHLPSETLTKNQAKKAADAVIRLFVNKYLRYLPVTDAERREMELPVRDTTPSPRPDPPTRPEFSIEGKKTRLVEVDFQDEGSESKAKPEGYAGAVIYWIAAAAPVTDPKKLPNSVLATSTPHILEFEEEDRGKIVSVALCWQNTKGRKGTATEVQTAIV
ncbi:MAG: hypothetical protein LBQ55_06885, partial [Treponema sp.]|nr:hypothetical protein [Treponema sp.]